MADEILLEEEPGEDPTPEPEPTPPTIVDRVKLSLRISHTLLDAEIEDYITSAEQELVRAGVAESKVEEQDEIVVTAIITYVKAQYASGNESTRYMESFIYQLDNLRKSYPGESDV